MKRKGITYAQLAEALKGLDIHETERNLNNKISRGGFTAAFFLQCLSAIGSNQVHTAMWALGSWSGAHNEHQRNAHEQNAPYPIGETPNAEMFWSGRAGTTSVYERICAYPIDKDQADLCQQWQLAQAAQNVANYTLISLMIGALGLFGLWRTVSLSNKATNAATAATKAATRSADATERMLTDLERPYVFVRVTEPGIHVSERRMVVNHQRFRYAFTNYGRSPARMRQVHSQVDYVAVNQGPPSALDPAQGGRTIPVGIFVAADTNQPYEEMENPSAIFDLYRLYQADWWTTEVIFWHGWFRYSDPSGSKRWLVGFDFMFDPIGGRFVVSGGEEHNYVREEHGQHEG